MQEIIDLESTIRPYIFEAIAIEKTGREVTLKKPSEFEMPDEFKEVVAVNSDLKSAF